MRKLKPKVVPDEDELPEFPEWVLKALDNPVIRAKLVTCLAEHGCKIPPVATWRGGGFVN